MSKYISKNWLLELKDTMAMCGAFTLKEITSEMVPQLEIIIYKCRKHYEGDVL